MLGARPRVKLNSLKSTSTSVVIKEQKNHGAPSRVVAANVALERFFVKTLNCVT